MGVHRPRRRATTAVITTAALVGLAAPPALGDAHDPFVGPLGLAIGDDGTMYVADAFGGELVAVRRDGQREVIATDDEIAGVDAAGKGLVVYASTDYAGAPGEPGPVDEAGLSRVTPNLKTSFLFSSHDYELANNPDAVNAYGFTGLDPDCLAQIPPEEVPPPYTGIIETHPYAVALLPDGGTLLADAAGNSVLRVSANGRHAETVAVLPPVPNLITEEVAVGFGLPACVVGATYYGEPVPTDVEVGPDGDWYVTSLPGGPELPGTGSVWRIDSSTYELEQVAGGLTFAVDLAIADDGTIWVAELFGGDPLFPGGPGGGRIVEATPAGPVHVADVPFPGAIEVAPDGSVWVTTNAVAIFLGQPPSGDVVQLLP